MSGANGTIDEPLANGERASNVPLYVRDDGIVSYGPSLVRLRRTSSG